MGVKIRLSEATDIDWLAENMREIDRQELDLTNGISPKQALEKGLYSSELCFTAVADGEPVAMFGATRYSLLVPKGSVWFLASKRLEKVKKTFVKESKPYLDKLFEAGIDRLENHVWVGNKLAIRWLRWLGFVFEEPAEYGRKKAMFMKFYKEK